MADQGTGRSAAWEPMAAEGLREPREQAVSVEGLRLKYPGEERLTFKDVSFKAAPGEKVLLLGPSGCGKSTLLQVLSGMIPKATEVPMKCENRQLPRSWAYVFQDPDTQFCMPYVDEELAFVLENLAVPRDEMKARMREALDAVGLHLKELHMPISHLSQGMKQRLALASALLLEPEVLFLDEPSALLDPEGRRQIWEAVKRVSAGRTLIIVEHRIEEMADYVDRIVLFGPDGVILGEGPPKEVFARYESELKSYGIWYPGVWEDYAASRAGQQWFPRIASSSAAGSLSSLEPVVASSGEGRGRPDQENEVVNPYASVSANRCSREPQITLQSFAGQRRSQPVIALDHAEVFPGDYVAILGPNGAGKSSLLLSLMGLLPSEGTYILGGEHVVKGKRKKLRKRREQQLRQIGFVFQNPELQFVTERVGDEVAYSLLVDGMPASEAEEASRSILERFGLHGLEGRHPYQLSTGQKRRLSVATAMARQPSVLLLDEPTFGQDARNTFAILEMCEQLRRSGTAILMVTHELQIAEMAATHIWEIREGRVVSQKVSPRLHAAESDMALAEVSS